MVLGSLLFAVLTAAGAAVSVPLPFSPVPVTLQTLMVVLAGAMLGPVWGALSQILYLTAGVSGLPVFANGAAGPSVLFGPTGGYLAGFVVSAWIAGLTVRPGAGWLRLATGLLAAHAVVFVFGLGQLMLFTARSLPAAATLGFWPFLPGLAAKTIAATLLLRSSRITGWFRS
jgi:biotin transport system substrate-specific component